MNAGKISARYAKALYEFASEKNSAEKVYEMMKVVVVAYEQLPNLRTALGNPTLSKDKKKELLNSITGNEECAEYTRFVDLVIEHKREEYFQSIALVYCDLYRKSKNLVGGKIITAAPISADEEMRFRQVLSKVTDAEIDFDIKVDPELIGGFILEVETYQLNASVKSQLTKIANKLSQINSSIA